MALNAVRKELDFCSKMKIPVIGVVENMSNLCCPMCKCEIPVFAPTTGGGQKMAEDFKVPFLGRIPMDPLLGKNTNHSLPVHTVCSPKWRYW